MHLEEELAGQFGHAGLAEAERHGDERIIAAAGSDRVELVFPTLEALLKIIGDVLHGFFLCALVRQAQRTVAVIKHHIAGFGVFIQQLIDA